MWTFQLQCVRCSRQVPRIATVRDVGGSTDLIIKCDHARQVDYYNVPCRRRVFFSSLAPTRPSRSYQKPCWISYFTSVNQKPCLAINDRAEKMVQEVAKTPLDQCSKNSSMRNCACVFIFFACAEVMKMKKKKKLEDASNCNWNFVKS